MWATVLCAVARSHSFSFARKSNARGIAESSQWFDKPVKPAGRGDGFEMSCGAPAIRFVVEYRFGPCRIWIWHPAWRTRYWFTRTTGSGMPTAVLTREWSELYRTWNDRWRNSTSQFLKNKTFIIITFFVKDNRIFPLAIAFTIYLNNCRIF